MAKTEKQVVSGYHRPVCVKCSCEMRPERNGVGVLDYASYGPYELYDADLWKCPKCGFEVVGGFAINPVAAHCDSDFPAQLAWYKSEGLLIENHTQ